MSCGEDRVFARNDELRRLPVGARRRQDGERERQDCLHWHGTGSGASLLVAPQGFRGSPADAGLRERGEQRVGILGADLDVRPFFSIDRDRRTGPDQVAGPLGRSFTPVPYHQGSAMRSRAHDVGERNAPAHDAEQEAEHELVGR